MLLKFSLVVSLANSNIQANNNSRPFFFTSCRRCLFVLSLLSYHHHHHLISLSSSFVVPPSVQHHHSSIPSSSPPSSSSSSYFVGITTTTTTCCCCCCINYQEYHHPRDHKPFLQLQQRLGTRREKKRGRYGGKNNILTTTTIKMSSSSSYTSNDPEDVGIRNVTTTEQEDLDGRTTTTTFHIVGDAYVDFFCFLNGDWPDRGGDSHLNQPVKSYAGGSSTNTATHLKSLITNFGGSEGKNTNPTQQQSIVESSSIVPSQPAVYLHTVLNPNDHYGQLLLQHSKDHNFPIINCRHSDDDQSSTGHCIAIVDRSGGERSFMTHQGCVGQFSAQDLQIETIINTPTDIHLHIAGFYNIPGFWNRQLLEKIQTIRDERKEKFPTKNTTVSLVTQHDATKQWDGGIDDLLPLLDFAIMNDLEANHIASAGFKRRKDQNQTSSGNSNTTTTTTTTNNNPFHDNEMILWESYFGLISPQTNVIVTRGEDGAIAIRDGQTIAIQAAKVVKPIDPTGAGDSFTAGFIHGIWSWKRLNPSSSSSESIDKMTNEDGQDEDEVIWPVESIREGLKWGCAVGRAAVLIRGASVPSNPEEILQFWPPTTTATTTTANHHE